MPLKFYNTCYDLKIFVGDVFIDSFYLGSYPLNDILRHPIIRHMVDFDNEFAVSGKASRQFIETSVWKKLSPNMDFSTLPVYHTAEYPYDERMLYQEVVDYLQLPFDLTVHEDTKYLTSTLLCAAARAHEYRQCQGLTIKICNDDYTWE